MRSTNRRRFLQASGLALALPQAGVSAGLKSETLRAFDQHVRRREGQMQQVRLGQGLAKFLWLDDQAARLSGAKSGQVVIEPAGGKAPIDAPGGLIHDWTAGVFVPGVNLAKVLSVVQDYDRHKQIYQPEVMDSKLLKRDGEEFKIYYRLMKKKVISAVLNTEHDVKYFPLGEGRVHSHSYSTKISEVENPGEPGEKELAPGEGHGFLWRLNSYWRFAERDVGVYVECEAISLSRGIPFGLGWMIEPIIRDLPQESLERSLGATRNALKA